MACPSSDLLRVPIRFDCHSWIYMRNRASTESPHFDEWTVEIRFGMKTSTNSLQQNQLAIGDKRQSNLSPHTFHGSIEWISGENTFFGNKSRSPRVHGNAWKCLTAQRVLLLIILQNSAVRISATDPIMENNEYHELIRSAFAHSLLLIKFTRSIHSFFFHHLFGF